MTSLVADTTRFWPATATGWGDVLGAIALIIGGGFALVQYIKSTQLKAAETLLKLEEEFHEVCGTYDEIEYRFSEAIEETLTEAVKKEPKLRDNQVKTLAAVDRALRFLYICSVLNQTLRADRVFRATKGAIPRAYYYYIGLLLKENLEHRKALQCYTKKFYPRLTAWVKKNEKALREVWSEAERERELVTK